MNASNDRYSDLQEATERVKAVKRAHEDELLNKANVVGLGVGYRRVSGEATRTPALVVMVSQKLPAALLGDKDLIPAWLDGVPVDVQEVGEIAAY